MIYYHFTNILLLFYYYFDYYFTIIFKCNHYFTIIFLLFTIIPVHHHSPVPSLRARHQRGQEQGTEPHQFEFRGHCFAADSRGTGPTHLAGPGVTSCRGRLAHCSVHHGQPGCSMDGVPGRCDLCSVGRIWGGRWPLPGLFLGRVRGSPRLGNLCATAARSSGPGPLSIVGSLPQVA